MSKAKSPRQMSRRDALRRISIAGAGLMLAGTIRGQAAPIMMAGKAVEIEVWSLSPSTCRIIVRPLVEGRRTAVPYTGALVQEEMGSSAGRGGESGTVARVQAGELIVRFTEGPPTIQVETLTGESIQRFVLSATDPGMTFLLGQGPLLGLGEGGPQFDRKGAADPMRNGQGGFQLATHGTRAPVQWMIGTLDGWGLFIHQPYGSFDFTGSNGVFTPRPGTELPLDLFVVRSRDPKVLMREYARITGLPELPARWTLGYMQSSRTLAGPEDILSVPRIFREKGLPCDAIIYLGTDFTPSGWNTRNGDFDWHPVNFPNPKEMIDQIHARHLRVILHIVIEGRTLTGTVSDPCTAAPLPSGRPPGSNQYPPDRQVSCYWPIHKTLMDVGVDGWWPDQGDGFDGPSRLNRHRMYWEGTQMYRPNQRPFALHRNASPGIQRFGGFIWSGDVQSRWQTLATHVSVAINTGLSGLPYWGSDIGGFIPTAEYTGELHVRWFQFGAFCPSFRAHGRHWHLRLPWGWNGGDGGPPETNTFRAAPEELNNPQVEPVIKKYLELRYRLLPYIYSAVRETHETGLPVMRALWLHYPEDPTAAARGDEYLWGPDILVAPVVEKGAVKRRLYLPAGAWHDFWTEERVQGGREIERVVDLATMPLYVRAGAVLPMGPVKQYAEEPTTVPITLVVFPGANGVSKFYDDDGISFNYRQGDWMGLAMEWQENARRLELRLVPGSRMMATSPRLFEVRLAGQPAIRQVRFDGSPVQIQL